MAEDPNKPERLKQLEKAQAALNKQYADTERHLRALLKLDKATGPSPERTAEIEKLAKSQFALNEEMAKQEKILQEQVKAYEKQAEALQQIEDRYEAASKAAGMFQGALNNIAGAFQQVTGLKIPMTVGDMATEFLGLATQVNTASTSLRKATGFTSKLDADLIQARKSTYIYGETWAETGERVAIANSEISLFAAQSFKTRSAMLETIGDLKGVGVSAETSAKSIDILSRGMGFTAMGATKATMELDHLAQSIGMVPNEVLQTFTNLGPELAKFGTRAPAVFRKMSRQARSLGLDVQQIFDVEKQFDTFEGSAEIAGTLNAQLGTRLNSVELLKATEGERLKILQQEFKLRGTNFEKMGRFQKKAIAEILGVDVDAAKRMFGDPVDLALYQAEMETINVRQQKMTSLAERFQGVMNNLFDKLAQKDGPVDTFLSYLEKIMKGFNPESITKWGDTLKNILIGVAGVMGASLGAAFTMTIGSTRMLIKQVQILVQELTKASKINPGESIDGGGGGDSATSTLINAGMDILGNRNSKRKRPGKDKTGGNRKFKLGKKNKMGALGGLLKGGLGKKGLMAGLKKLPGLGLLMGGGMAINRLMEGDYLGALLQAGAGVASTIPGAGTAIAMGLEGMDIARQSMQSDFIMRGNKVTPFRKDDIIMGGTSLLDQGSGGGMSSRDTKKLADAIGQEVSKAVTGALKGTQSKTVKLMLNERELGSVVTNIIEEKLSLTTA